MCSKSVKYVTSQPFFFFCSSFVKSETTRLLPEEFNFGKRERETVRQRETERKTETERNQN